MTHSLRQRRIKNLSTIMASRLAARTGPMPLSGVSPSSSRYIANSSFRHFFLPSSSGPTAEKARINSCDASMISPQGNFRSNSLPTMWAGQHVVLTVCCATPIREALAT